MKKILGATLGIAFSLFLCGCGKKGSTTTKDSKSTTKGPTTTNKVTTNEKPKKEVTVPYYKSDYTKELGEKLPVIKINSETGTNNFVTDPVSHAVKEQKKGWLSPSDSQLQFPDPYYENCTITVTDESDATTINAVSGKVKVRGNWTTDYAKKPLRIKFDEKQTMLGLNNGKKFKSWVLLASYKDWSMTRDIAGLYLSKLISRNYTSDFKLCEVYVNNTYWGIYLLAEQQQTGKNRINITEPAENYTGTDIGYLLEYDGYYKYEDFNFTVDHNKMLMDADNNIINHFNNGYTIKSDIYSDTQTNFIKGYMNSVWKICREAIYGNYYKLDSTYTGIEKDDSVDNVYDCISKVINVESLIDTYIIQEIACDPDLYWSSFYMSVDFGENGSKQLTFQAPWDFDSSMGNKRFCENAQGIYAGKISTDANGNGQEANPWMLVFINQDWFKDLTKQKWQMIYEQNVFDKVYTYMDQISQKYVTEFANNYSKWGNINRNDLVGNELCNASSKCKTEAEAEAYVKSWLQNRVTYLNSIWGK